jgi:hypothetical protein
MMQTVKGIRFVGPGELEREYGLKPNSVAHYKGTGKFPSPVLKYDKAHIYLADDIEAFTRQLNKEKNTPAVAGLLRDMKRMGVSKTEQDKVRKHFENLYGPLDLDDELPKVTKPRRRRTT